KSAVSTKSTSRICSGASTKSSLENSTLVAAADRRMTFAKSKKLLRDVKWFGRRMSLHSRYWISLSGRPSAYLPGLTSGIRVTLRAFFSIVFFAARFGIVFLNVVSRGRRTCAAAPSEPVGDDSPRVKARGQVRGGVEVNHPPDHRSSLKVGTAIAVHPRPSRA